MRRKKREHLTDTVEITKVRDYYEQIYANNTET